ncbi:MAG: hypothetical protein FVQ83_05660 [Chloroflexi bacterium]|nr:hypothetical protein [Chloroflexota bacterium]
MESENVNSPRATILEGITLAKDMVIKVVKEQSATDQLYMEDEVFVCGTAAEVVALGEIVYRSIGEGGVGMVTKDLQRSFFKTAQGDGSHSVEWLDHVSFIEASFGI